MEIVTKTTCNLCGEPWLTICPACGLTKGQGYGCAVLPVQEPEAAETEQGLERDVVQAAITFIAGQRRLFEGMKRPTDPYWDVRVSDAVAERDAGRLALEAAVGALQRYREART